ncbi:MAG: hypothetical protein AAB074_13345 [Planctomycetota bacterium]
MLKGILLGTVVGAVLAAGAYRAFAWHRSPDSPAPAAPGSPTSKSEPSPDPELRALVSEGERLRGELASLEKSGGSGDAAVKPPARKGPTWKELGAKVYKLREQMKDKSERSAAETELMGDFFSLLSDAAKKYGVSMEEAMMSPEGMLGLLLGVLEGSDLPPDAAQMAKIQALMAAADKGWMEYVAGRESLTGMERSLDMLEISGGGFLGIRGVLRTDQIEMLDGMDMFNDIPSMAPRHSVSGDRESVAAQIGGQWKSALKLDDTQAASIAPIVGEYMRAYDEIQAEAEKKKAAGEKVNDWTTAVAEAELMVSVQKRMKETLRLSEEQEKAMKEWTGIYGYEIGTR